MKESILADLADPKDRIVNEETLVPPQLRSRVPAPQATAAGTSKSHGP